MVSFRKYIVILLVVIIVADISTIKIKINNMKGSKKQ